MMKYLSFTTFDAIPRLIVRMAFRCALVLNKCFCEPSMRVRPIGLFSCSFMYVRQWFSNRGSVKALPNGSFLTRRPSRHLSVMRVARYFPSIYSWIYICMQAI